MARTPVPIVVQAFLAVIFVMSLANRAAAEMLPVLQKNNRRYVTASALETEAGIAIKPLPGRNEVVACFEDRCALVRDFIRDGGEILVGLDELAEALGASIELDQTQQKTALKFKSQPASSVKSIVRVGQLAPDFKLAKLDGTPVSLSDFRGKRVIINSWASW